MSITAANPPLNPDQSIIYGSQIDRDLNITDRGRRKMIARGVLPPPDGYLGGRAFWTTATYATFKAELLAGKHGRPRRPGFPANAAA
jgi:hypothetical protein